MNPLTASLDFSHDATLRSWVASANLAETDFPIQNLPLGMFRRAGSAEMFRPGVAIGDQIVDLLALKDAGLLTAEVAASLAGCENGELNAFMARGRLVRVALRHALSALLREGSLQQSAVQASLLAQADAEYAVPCRIGDYTDFYTLAPFRAPFVRAEVDPQPLPYLNSTSNQQQGGLDVALEVLIQTEAMRAAGLPPQRLSQSNYRDAYWTVAQMITHHAVNGCNLQAGDLLGSGTQSGVRPEQAGSLLELSAGGKNPLTLANGESRTFLQDGDAIILRAHCERSGFRRIGFGDCQGQVLAAHA